MRTEIFSRIAFAVALFSLAINTCSAVDIQMATAYGDDNFHTQNIKQFADAVRLATKGEANFVLHTGGKLLKTPSDIFAGVKSGTAQAGEAIMSGLSQEDPIFAIDSLSFIVSDYDDAKKLWTASKPLVEKALEQRGLKLLYAVPWPPQNLYSTREINNVKDMAGLNMRAYSPTTTRIAELVGAKPVTIQAAELSKAIADDKVDLMLTSSSTGVDTKAWSKMKYYYKVVAWIPKNIVFINNKFFTKLSSNAQLQIMQEAATAEARGWVASQQSDATNETMLKSKNTNVAQMDYVIRTYLDRIGEKLSREWLASAGTEKMMVLLDYTTKRSLK